MLERFYNYHNLEALKNYQNLEAAKNGGPAWGKTTPHIFRKENSAHGPP